MILLSMDDKTRKIQEIVAEEYNITLKDLKGKKEVSQIATPRQIAMYLTKTMIVDISTTDIGDAFGGRDHTTVMHACNKIKLKLESDAYFETLINKIMNKIKKELKEFNMKCKFCGSENTKDVYVVYEGNQKGITRHALGECLDCKMQFGYTAITEIPKIISAKYDILKE